MIDSSSLPWEVRTFFKCLGLTFDGHGIDSVTSSACSLREEKWYFTKFTEWFIIQKSPVQALKYSVLIVSHRLSIGIRKERADCVRLGQND